MSSIPVFDISNPLGGLMDQAVSMGYINEKRTTTKDAVATFDDNIEHAVSIKADIDPTLDGVTEVKISRSGEDTSDPDVTTISLGSTVHGGSVSVSEEGEVELTETYNHGTLKSNAPNFTESISTNFTTYYTKISTIFTDIKATGYAKGLCDQFTFTDSPGATDVNVAYVQSGYLNIRVESGTYADAAAFKDWVIENGIELTYEKAESTSTDLTDIDPIETLEGENNIWADTGDIEVGYFYQLYQPI